MLTVLCKGTLVRMCLAMVCVVLRCEKLAVDYLGRLISECL